MACTWNPPPLPMHDAPASSPEQEAWARAVEPGPFTPTRLFPAKSSDWTPMNPLQMIPSQEHPNIPWDYLPVGPGHPEVGKTSLPDVPLVPGHTERCHEDDVSQREHRWAKASRSDVDSPRTPRRGATGEDIAATSPSPRRVGVDGDRNLSLPATPMQVRSWVPETPSPLAHRAHHHMHLLSASLAVGDRLPPPMPIAVFAEDLASW